MVSKFESVGKDEDKVNNDFFNMRRNGITFLFIGVLIVTSIFFIINDYKANKNVPTNIPTNISTNTTNNLLTSVINNLSTNYSKRSDKENNSQPTVTKNVCEGCHMSGKGSVPQALTVKPHSDGGIYCLTCHNSLHTKHPINKDVTCEKCHGYVNQTIPISSPDIACVNCHNYPNSLEKSMGNLITIHRPREVSCTNCHVDTCTKCHKEVGNDERWEKRLSHFNTILMKH